MQEEPIARSPKDSSQRERPNQQNGDLCPITQHAVAACSLRKFCTVECPPILVPKDTDNALFAVQECFDKFYPLLTGKSMPEPTPAIQFDWEDAFGTHGCRRRLPSALTPPNKRNGKPSLRQFSMR
jgi:hypothetical protein